ncbi:uncharacterized protein [Amphiura filiformis]|uniref:uncharacterized protein n=1 Tax=Amphiura filiformis TaxID=82378 RepID=UPI003B2151D2
MSDADIRKIWDKVEILFKNRMPVEDDVLQQLQAKGILDDVNHAAIKQKSAPQDRRKELFEILKQKSSKIYLPFLRFLESRKQCKPVYDKFKKAESTVGLTIGPGEMKPDIMQAVLQEYTELLSDFLNPTPVIQALVKKRAITDVEVQKIQSKTSKPTRVQELIGILQKKPLTSYNTFMEELSEVRADLHQQVKKIEYQHFPDPSKPLPQTQPRVYGVVPETDGSYKKQMKKMIQKSKPTERQKKG